MTVAEQRHYPDLTAFQRDLLIVIDGLDQPMGLDVKQRLERYYDERINNGRLYPNLDELVERDLVAKGERDGRTNTYELTGRGLRALDSRRAWEDGVREGER